MNGKLRAVFKCGDIDLYTALDINICKGGAAIEGSFINKLNFFGNVDLLQGSTVSKSIKGNSRDRIGENDFFKGCAA